jgi:hypothetical protein
MASCAPSPLQSTHLTLTVLRMPAVLWILTVLQVLAVLWVPTVSIDINEGMRRYFIIRSTQQNEGGW